MYNSFLYTVPQWIIFSGIVAIIYGWVEHKRQFRILGTSILIALGLYSLYVILGDYLAAHEYFTPYEIAMYDMEEQELLPEDEIILEELPIQIKLFPAYISFLVSAALAIPALIFELLKNKKLFQIFIIISVLAALVGFFIVVDTIRTI